MQLKSRLLVPLFFFLSISAFADSPLTSTDFAKAYQHDKYVRMAEASVGGILTDELAAVLMGTEAKIEIKMAIINQLGWSIDGKDNAKRFFKYLVKKKSYRDKDDLIRRGTGDEILCMAYLLALDDYNNVKDAVEYAEKAVNKNHKSYTYHIIAALIKAQAAFDKDWCKVYQLTDTVRRDKTLNQDMRSDATKIIFEYMDLYKDECK